MQIKILYYEVNLPLHLSVTSECKYLFQPSGIQIVNLLGKLLYV